MKFLLLFLFLNTYYCRQKSENEIVSNILVEKFADGFQNNRLSLFGNAQNLKSVMVDVSAYKSVNETENPMESIFKVDVLSFPLKYTNLKGPNICENNIHFSVPIYDKYGSHCHRFKDAAVCLTTTETGKATRRIQECCEGYTTDDISESGCTIEITEQLLSSYNISLSEVPFNSTVLVTKSGETSYILAGEYRNIYEYENKQVLRTLNDEKFVMRTDGTVEVHLNCALKKQTFKTNTSTIHLLEGRLEPAAENVLDIIETRPELSTFYNLLGDELQTVLRESNESTVFAFTNEAFEKLPESTRKQILNGEKGPCVQKIMKQHISLAGSYCDSSLPAQIPNENNNELHVQQEPILKIENSTIVTPSLFAINGVVHVINNLLVNEHYICWNEMVRSFNPELADALKTEDLENQTLTIFIPENSTMIHDAKNYIISNQLLKSCKDKTTLKTDAGSEIFTGTNTEDWKKLFTGQLDMKEYLSLQLGQIGCSRFVSQPVQACNAIIHFIDKALPIVNQSIDEFLASRADLSTFYGLWKDFKNTSTEFYLTRKTIFVPNNEAFSSNVIEPKSVDKFVKRHIVEGNLCSFDIEKKPSELQSQPIFSIGDDFLQPTGSAISGAEIQESEIILSDAVVYILKSAIEAKSNTTMVSREDVIKANPFVQLQMGIIQQIFG